MGHTFKNVVDDLTALGEVHDGASALDGQSIVGDGYKGFQDFRFRFFDWAEKAEGSVFHQWCSSQSQEWGDSYARKLKLANDTITNLHMVISDLRFGKPNGSQEKVESQLSRFKDRMFTLVSFASERMQEAGPESYSYGGFKIENPYRFTDTVLHRLNGALDWIKSLFKSRGITAVLNQTIRVVGLSWDDPSAAGAYYSDQLRIELYLDHLPELTGRKSNHFRDFFREVVLHEIAHHLHLHFLHPDARKSWDSGWAEVAEVKALKPVGIRISPEDRGRFFELLRHSKGSLRSVLSKLQDLDKVKFKFWLSYAWGNDTVLVSPHQLKLTEYGKRVVSYFKDPKAFKIGLIESYLGESDGSREFDRFREILYSRLGLNGLSADNSVPLPAQLLTEDQASPVDKAINELGIPTTYGKTNYMEDFAETFVYFMLDPGKLSERALTRMQRALATSNLYGKPVMRIASRVADAYLQKHGASEHVAMPHRGPFMFREQVIRFERVADKLLQHRVKFDAALEDAISTLRSGGDMRSGSPEALAVKLLENYQERVALMPNLFPENEWAEGDYSAMQWPDPLLDAAERYYRK